MLFRSGPILTAWTSARGGKPLGPEEEPRKKYPGGMRAPKGWKTAEAHFYFEEAQKASGEKKWALCAGYASDSYAVEERVSTKYLRATCNDKRNAWREARIDYEEVAKDAPGLGMNDVGKRAKERAEYIADKSPRVSFKRPPNAQDLVVSIDDLEIPGDQLSGEIVSNPGTIRVRASGMVSGQKLVFDREFTLDRKSTRLNSSH